MDLSKFGSNTTGRLVPISGVVGATHAFIPDKLPPNWEWPSQLWPLLLEARTALASLDGTGKHLPNPQLLLRPLQSREALRSSSLEGTYTTPKQQLIFEINPQYPRSEDDPINAYREVFNYGRALRLRLESQEALPLSLRLIRELHQILLDGVRGRDKEPGAFRRLRNQVGRPPRYVPPPPNYLAECLDAFEKYLHQERHYDPLVDAFLAHYQFEAIHPFRDGNGRVGRLLLAIMIAEWCNLSNQWLYMSAFFDTHRDDYMDHLLRISTDGHWEGWIEFCLHGVIAQAKDTERRCDKLLNLTLTVKERIQSLGGSYRLNSIADNLFVRPVVTISQISKDYNVSYPTAKADIEKLASVGILIEFSDITPKTYFSPEILEITFEDLETVY